MHEDLKEKLNKLRESKGLRTSRALHVNSHLVSRSHALDTRLVNFSSNDYLGLAGDLSLQQSFFDSIDLKAKPNWLSASSARPLTGTSLSHEALERSIASEYGKDKALLFNSGYHANSGILPALAAKDDLILADKLVHASIIDGLRLGAAAFKRFAHNDLNHLETLLERYSGEYTKIWIVTESVFSMDGDVAPLSEMVLLKKKFDALLYVDEAHAVGCYGDKGLGLSESLALLEDVDILVGVFGKALAGMGAYVVSDEILIEGLVNFSRSWLFSTALPPLNIEWNLFVWNQLSHLQERRRQLQHLTTVFRELLFESEYTCQGETYIVPLMLCSVSKNIGNQYVVNLSEYLERKGFLALPIRSPTVKAGSERVRFSLTANIPEESLEDVVDALFQYKSEKI